MDSVRWDESAAYQTMKTTHQHKDRPEILAPAGNQASFLAALAAGADAVYCGLKSFSARMEAKNFRISDLSALTQLAHQRGTRVYVALNAMLRPGDLRDAGKLLDDLQRQVRPDALIIQDPGVIELSRQTGFTGEIHFSTLANVSTPAGLEAVKKLDGVRRVVLPRELNIDEIRAMAAACPEGIALEVFVHGALCYAVSGRCYWSSYLGGKSGLRGRCVQPCRRVYQQDRRDRRYFSCQDLSLDVLAKVLRSIPQIKAWKIEGRKKGPHYVYYTTTAYRMLRDLDLEPEQKTIAQKSALELLARSLGRPGTHYGFLPQRPQKAVDVNARTGSGLFVGKVQGKKGSPFLSPRIELLSGDVLRVGYEDDAWHAILRVGRNVPSKGRFHLNTASRQPPARGAPVFLTDRREKALEQMLAKLQEQMSAFGKTGAAASGFIPKLPGAGLRPKKVFELEVHRIPGRLGKAGRAGIWLDDEVLKQIDPKRVSGTWWWLAPTGWPAAEAEHKNTIDRTIHRGGRNFVLNALWQRALFPDSDELQLWAGPFCNLANPFAFQLAARMGFSGVIVTPELGREEFASLPRHSPLPLGIVMSGNWPLCISRTKADEMAENRPFQSPKGEQAWLSKVGDDWWIFPNWRLDLTEQAAQLRKAGYQLFVHLVEPVPPAVNLRKREGLWNWKLGLK